MKKGQSSLKGCHNFRDLGGLQTKDGRLVKKNLLYRSDCLHRITKENQNYLLSLNIREVIDFRGPYEVKKKTDRLPSSIKYHNLAIDAAGKDREEKIKEYLLGKSYLDLSEYMKNTYREIILHCSQAYKQWFQRLLESRGEYAILFHCTAGKDRTGLAAAFFLDMLGVPYPLILEDYLRTNQLTSRKIDSIVKRINRLSFYRMKGEKLRPLLGVEESFLQAAWDCINERWGSRKKYYEEELGMGLNEIETLKKIYLN